MIWHMAGVLRIVNHVPLDIVYQLRLGLDRMTHPRHSAVGS